jgi:hypothetical protein
MFPVPASNGDNANEFETDADTFEEWLKRRDPERFNATKPKVGRPNIHDWDAFWIETFGRVYINGIPENQMELVRKMLQWLESNKGKQPHESEVRNRISALCTRLKKADSSES